jgi:hypothetical protein
MTRRRTPRDIVIDMLVRWGEHEALGLYAAAAERSILGRIRDGGSHPPCGGSRPLPPGIWIPADVMEIGRILAHVRETSRAGERYYRAIRYRFVVCRSDDAMDDQVSKVFGLTISAYRTLLSRSISCVVDAWLDNRRAA